MTSTAPRKLLRKKTEPTEEALPQGIVVGCKGGKHSTTAMIDTGDVHVLMIGAAGVGRSAFWLYPCVLEYACASGMSFLSTDTKGDVMRNYGNIAKDYGYKVSVIDLRNPTRSNGNNILYLVNKYTDLYAKHPDQIVYKAKAEKYAKTISKTIILSGMDAPPSDKTHISTTPPRACDRNHFVGSRVLCAGETAHRVGVQGHSRATRSVQKER